MRRRLLPRPPSSSPAPPRTSASSPHGPCSRPSRSSPAVAAARLPPPPPDHAAPASAAARLVVLARGPFRAARLPPPPRPRCTCPRRRAPHRRSRARPVPRSPAARLCPCRLEVLPCASRSSPAVKWTFYRYSCKSSCNSGEYIRIFDLG